MQNSSPRSSPIGDGNGARAISPFSLCRSRVSIRRQKIGASFAIANAEPWLWPIRAWPSLSMSDSGTTYTRRTSKRWVHASPSPAARSPTARPAWNSTGRSTARPRAEGGALEIWFDHAEGLHSSGNELKGFEVAGADGHFVAATAKVQGTSVVVSSREVAEPVQVRYAWQNFTRRQSLQRRSPAGIHVYRESPLNRKGNRGFPAWRRRDGLYRRPPPPPEPPLGADCMDECDGPALAGLCMLELDRLLAEYAAEDAGPTLLALAPASPAPRSPP